MARDEETPGAKAERERLARQAEDTRALARQRRIARDKQTRADRAAERARLQEEEQRAQEAHAVRQRGRNEAAVVEYLRRHPDALVKDVAFHAIYGGGTVAWEGLHWKTRRNAEAEASRVLARLKSQGIAHQSGWTGGGRPKHSLTSNAPEPDADRLRKWFGTSGDIEEDAPKKKSMGVFGDPLASDVAPVQPNQGQVGPGKGVPGINTPSTGEDSGDDSGGDDDKGTGFLKPSW